MARILSHPFRLLANGAAATVEQDTDAGDAEQIAVLILTRRKERPLVSGFGMTDPTFGGFDVGELAAGVTIYGPPRPIADVVVRVDTGDAQIVDVVYQ